MMDLIIFKDGSQERVEEKKMSQNMAWDDGFNAYITFMFGTVFMWYRVAWFEIEV